MKIRLHRELLAHIASSNHIRKLTSRWYSTLQANQFEYVWLIFLAIVVGILGVSPISVFVR